MAKIKCYSVRLKNLNTISNKCLKAVAFDGSEAFIPVSCYYGPDFGVSKTDAYWIAAFVLENEGCTLQFSKKKVQWFNK